MKTRAALALSVAGILVTGSAALAVNTHVLNTTPAGTGNANSVLLPGSPGRTPAPAAAVGAVGATTTADASSVAGDGTTASVPAKHSGVKASADGKVGDHRGTRGTRGTASSPKPADKGKAGSVSDKTVAGRNDAGPAGSQPTGADASLSGSLAAGSQSAGTAGSRPAAGDPAVVVQGDDKGVQRTVPEPGDDKGGQRTASERGDDKGGHGSDD
jgi:hypothetical protein